jgi:pimeloyl-ACP methyl ester carboxylesterase
VSLPFGILGMWLRGLVAVGVLAFGVYFVSRWYRDLPTHEVIVAERDPDRPVEPGSAPPVREGRPLGAIQRVTYWQPALDGTTAALVGGVMLLTLAFAGRCISSLLLGRAGGGENFHNRVGRAERLRRPDGTELNLETYGAADGPTVIATHGWGVDSTEWRDLKRALSDRARLVVWDLPGTGRSSAAGNNDYSVERFAQDLDAVIAANGNGPVFLVGHSIGGMIALTYCRKFPEALGARIAGMVLVHSTYTNPVRTARWAALYSALQKPVIEPLLHLTVWLSPLVWLMNWLSYMNGSAHRSARRQSFAGTQTREQIDYVARFYAALSPAVLARGMLGMLDYDATRMLGATRVPTLVVAGDRDPQTVPEAQRLIAETMPHGRLVTLTPASHQGHLERHKEFTDAVVEFVTSPQRITLSGQRAMATR